MPTDTRAPIVRVPWEDFRRKLRRRIHAGEHAVIIGSTGSGKSFLAREVVPMFGRNIVVLDGKGGDDPSLVFPGFTTIRSWPPPAEGALFRSFSGRKAREPIRVHLAPKVRTITDALPGGALWSESRKVLQDLYTRKGGKVFALYVDEMQIIADPREGLGLGKLIGPLLRVKRYDHMSVVTATQYPTWIPRSSYRETTHRFFFAIEDEESRKRLGEISGRRAEITPVLDSLRPHEFAYQDVRRPREFLVSKVRR